MGGADEARVKNILHYELTRLGETARIWLLLKAERAGKLEIRPFRGQYAEVVDELSKTSYLVDLAGERLVAVREGEDVYVPFLGKLVPYEGR